MFMVLQDRQRIHGMIDPICGVATFYRDIFGIFLLSEIFLM